MLLVDPSRARFPARCVGCGAAPQRDVTLESFRGIDLLYFRWGHRCEVSLPVCRRCWGQRWRRRVAWFAAMIGAIIGFIVACALLTNDANAQPVMVTLVVVLLPYLWFMRAREQELFQRVASPVWLRNWQPKRNLVELGFRDAQLEKDVAVLSGLAAPPMREANYREPAIALPPPAWSGPRVRSLPWWAALIVGGVFFAVAIGEFVQYSQLERTGESFSDQVLFVWIYELGGKWALSGLLALFGLLFVAGGFLLRRKKLV